MDGEVRTPRFAIQGPLPLTRAMHITVLEDISWSNIAKVFGRSLLAAKTASKLVAHLNQRNDNSIQGAGPRCTRESHVQSLDAPDSSCYILHLLQRHSSMRQGKLLLDCVEGDVIIAGWDVSFSWAVSLVFD